MAYVPRSKPYKEFSHLGKLEWLIDDEAQNTKLVVLVGYGGRRVRLDYKRVETIEGWQRTVTRVQAWKLGSAYSYQPPHTYFSKTFVH